MLRYTEKHNASWLVQTAVVVLLSLLVLFTCGVIDAELGTPFRSTGLSIYFTPPKFLLGIILVLVVAFRKAAFGQCSRLARMRCGLVLIKSLIAMKVLSWLDILNAEFGARSVPFGLSVYISPPDINMLVFRRLRHNAHHSDCLHMAAAAAGVYQDRMYQEDAIFVTAANFGYLDMLESWMCHMDRAGFKYLLIALDHRLSTYLATTHPSRPSCLFMPNAASGRSSVDPARSGSYGTPAFNAVACAKLEAVRALLAVGRTVIFCDADIRFLRDPFPELLLLSAQCTYAYQQNIENPLNRTLSPPPGPNVEGNTGFYLARPGPVASPAARALLRLFDDAVAACAVHADADDQTNFWRVVPQHHAAGRAVFLPAAAPHIRLTEAPPTGGERNRGGTAGAFLSAAALRHILTTDSLPPAGERSRDGSTGDALAPSGAEAIAGPLARGEGAEVDSASGVGVGGGGREGAGGSAWGVGDDGEEEMVTFCPLDEWRFATGWAVGAGSSGIAGAKLDGLLEGVVVVHANYVAGWTNKRRLLEQAGLWECGPPAATGGLLPSNGAADRWARRQMFELASIQLWRRMHPSPPSTGTSSRSTEANPAGTSGGMSRGTGTSGEYGSCEKSREKMVVVDLSTMRAGGLGSQVQRAAALLALAFGRGKVAVTRGPMRAYTNNSVCRSVISGAYGTDSTAPSSRSNNSFVDWASATDGWTCFFEAWSSCVVSSIPSRVQKGSSTAINREGEGQSGVESWQRLEPKELDGLEKLLRESLPAGLAGGMGAMVWWGALQAYALRPNRRTSKLFRDHLRQYDIKRVDIGLHIRRGDKLSDPDSKQKGSALDTDDYLHQAELILTALRRDCEILSNTPQNEHRQSPIATAIKKLDTWVNLEEGGWCPPYTVYVATDSATAARRAHTWAREDGRSEWVRVVAPEGTYTQRISAGGGEVAVLMEEQRDIAYQVIVASHSNGTPTS